MVVTIRTFKNSNSSGQSETTINLDCVSEVVWDCTALEKPCVIMNNGNKYYFEYAHRDTIIELIGQWNVFKHTKDKTVFDRIFKLIGEI